MESKSSIYQIITDRLVKEMEAGVIPWRRAWSGGGHFAKSYVTGKYYSFLNQLLIGRPGEFLTFHDIQKLGGTLKKGCHGYMCTFCKQYIKESDGATQDENENENNNDDNKKKIFVLRYYTIFSVDDVDGVERKEPIKEMKDKDPLEAGQKIIDTYLNSSDHPKFESIVSDEAYYMPAFDSVTVPLLKQFDNAEEYYSTAFHELIHSTMKETRCNRREKNKIAAFGSKDYGKEELIAEMGAAMLCNIAGIETSKSFKNSAAYLQGWIKAIKGDPKLIVFAAGAAEKAAKYIQGIK